MDPILQTDIKYLKGVGPIRGKMLGEDLKIFTLREFPIVYGGSLIARILGGEENA